MTQAGGRLAPELVGAYAGFARDHGLRFYAMYGQTEAAPRMAYLPPEQALQNPDCIGVPIPGGEFRLISEDGEEVASTDTVGELVYRGANVMMGYALSQDDLALPPGPDELRTGDLAMRTPEGLYRIVGRASRFVKIAGLRIGLDDLEDVLRAGGFRARVSGSDARVAICVVGESSDPAAARQLVAQQCGLPLRAIAAFALPEEPRLTTGKVDYGAIRALAEEQAARDAQAAQGSGPIAAAFASALGVSAPPADATFASLGGDSLSYVNASIGLEEVLGKLPLGWETMTIAALEEMAPVEAPPKTAFGWISSEIVVRVCALSLVIAGHAAPNQTEFLRGGSNILFAVAGYNLARFQRDNLLKGSVVPAVLGSFYRVILPYLLCVLVILPTSEADKSIGWPLLVSVYTVEFRGPLFAYWFIESVFHALLLTCALFLAPPFRRLARARPFASAVGLVAFATAFMVLMPLLWNDGREKHLTFDAWLYAYYLGFAAYLARNLWQKGLLVVIAAAVAGAQYGWFNPREVWLAIGLLVVLFIPRLKLPTIANRAVLAVAASSYFIYLMHVFAAHVLIVKGTGISSPFIRFALLWTSSVLLGMAYAWGWNLMAPRALGVMLRVTGKWRLGRRDDRANT